MSSGDAESQYLVSVKKDSMVTAVGDGHRTTWELKIDGDKQYPVVSDARGIPSEASTRADLVETANHASVQDTEDAVVSKGGGVRSEWSRPVRMEWQPVRWWSPDITSKIERPMV